MPDLNERTEELERAVNKALYESLIGGYEVIDTPQGTTVIGPVGAGHSRDLFVVRVIPAKLEVNDG